MVKQLEAPVEFSEHYFGIEWLNTEDLIVDHRYQRLPQNMLIKSIKENWDWRAVRTLAVSLRVIDGRNIYAVIDGQQRLTAARESNIEKLPCQIYIDLTEEQEAELFLKLNNSKKPTANDMFRAKIAEGDQEAKLIMMALRNTNWEFDPDMVNHKGAKGNDYCANAVGSATALTTIYRQGGVLHLQKILNLITGWKGQHLAASADILLGFNAFLLKYQDKVDLSKLTEKLANETPSAVLGRAIQLMAADRQLYLTATGTRSKALARVFVGLYNKGLRVSNKLEE